MSNRTFRIPDGPSVVDPCHFVAAWEIIDIAGKEAVALSDFKEIADYIRKIELKDAENVGYSKACNEICEMFGVTNFVGLESLARRLE